MTSLIEIIDELDAHNDEGTIYASEPWTENSKVIVAAEPRSGDLPKSVEDLGLKYFLEVSVAKEFLEGWISNLGRVPSTAEKTQRLIQYAINDA
jgi:hypothetical protein